MLTCAGNSTHRLGGMNMSRIFVTGSTDGLGKVAAQLLIDQGHQVVLHARQKVRAKEALAAVPGAEAVAVGDMASIAQTRDVAEQINRLATDSKFDALNPVFASGFSASTGHSSERDALQLLFGVKHTSGQ